MKKSKLVALLELVAVILVSAVLGYFILQDKDIEIKTKKAQEVTEEVTEETEENSEDVTTNEDVENEEDEDEDEE